MAQTDWQAEKTLTTIPPQENLNYLCFRDKTNLTNKKETSSVWKIEVTGIASCE